MVSLTEKDGAVTFAVRVQPRASRSEVVGEVAGALKVRLAAPPVDGAANEELLRLLAKVFGVGRAQVEIVMGTRGRQKAVRVRGRTAVECARNLSAVCAVKL
jgi:uncharacterized protein (TIGR00251 family)